MDQGNSYYPEDQSDEAAEPAGHDESKENEYGSESALIPKALLAGKDFKPGDEVVFKIVHMYEDEVEIEYSTGPDEKKESKSTMDESMEKMDSMATKEG